MVLPSWKVVGWIEAFTWLPYIRLVRYGLFLLCTECDDTLLYSTHRRRLRRCHTPRPIADSIAIAIIGDDDFLAVATKNAGDAVVVVLNGKYSSTTQ